jgi:hypothetical protein
MKKEELTNIENWMLGEWEASFEENGKKVKMRLSIYPSYSSHLVRNEDGKEVLNTFIDDPDWWFDTILEFGSSGDKKQYYIKHADENVLVFGEYEGGAVLENVQWEHKFNRMPLHR